MALRDVVRRRLRGARSSLSRTTSDFDILRPRLRIATIAPGRLPSSRVLRMARMAFALNYKEIKGEYNNVVCPKLSARAKRAGIGLDVSALATQRRKAGWPPAAPERDIHCHLLRWIAVAASGFLQRLNTRWSAGRHMCANGRFLLDWWGKCPTPERWPSGLRRTLGKRV